jgi:adenine-specific DNA-methyltransferase
LLWLRASAIGKSIDKLPPNGWAVADTYGLLTDVDQATPFIEEVNKAENLRLVYIVTDDRSARYGQPSHTKRDSHL